MNKNNLKFIILDYLAAKKSGILNWRRFLRFSNSIWEVMPSRHLMSTIRSGLMHYTSGVRI